MVQQFHRIPVVTDYRLRAPRMLQHITLALLAFLIVDGVLLVLFPESRTLMGTGLLVAVLLLVPAAGVWLAIWVLQRARYGLRDRMVAMARLRGDETVLDVGCGSGILLFALLKSLPQGRGIGIDIYDPNAGGGTDAIFWKNAHAEGLAKQVALQNVDARQMPFEDQSFDVIVSSFAMHHMGGNAERELVMREMARVLKPGGRLVIADVSAALVSCESAARQAGLTLVQRSGHRFQILYAEKG